MSNKSVRCYFRCVNFDVLHKFPSWDHPYTEKFNLWKAVLDKSTQERGNKYIINSIRLCSRHFKDVYKSQYSGKLTRNAVPTLNLDKNIKSDRSCDLPHNYAANAYPQTNLPTQGDCNDNSNQQPEQIPRQVEGHFSWQQDSIVVPCDDDPEQCLSPPTPAALDAGASGDELYGCEPPKRAPSAPPSLVHEGYRCDVCCADIVGFRYTCVQCADFDLCGACEARQAHAAHYVLRIPGPRPYSEVAAKLRTIRRALLSDAIVLVRGDTCDAPAEVKEEPPQEDPIHVEPLRPVCANADSLDAHKSESSPPKRELRERASPEPEEITADYKHEQITSEHEPSALKRKPSIPDRARPQVCMKINKTIVMKPLPILLRRVYENTKIRKKDAQREMRRKLPTTLEQPENRETSEHVPELRIASGPQDTYKKIKLLDFAVQYPEHLHHLEQGWS